ncbi:Secreted protein [Vibrio crassostreae]|nr:Secreted protein [Vibrio crassostreae]CAK2022361.1 Secreted protein [Vibrio crassostreae]CAK2022594.1 Secreted protein [Vibrio crassostreae]CAK2024409.1 Secreted protein [Vibrio crassostreae]CAK2025202.1 Secreted protein [Vibrio crassostreae]
MALLCSVVYLSVSTLQRMQLVTLLSLTMYELYTISKANCWKNVNLCVVFSDFIDLDYRFLVNFVFLNLLFLNGNSAQI